MPEGVLERPVDAEPQDVNSTAYPADNAGNNIILPLCWYQYIDMLFPDDAYKPDDGNGIDFGYKGQPKRSDAESSCDSRVAICKKGVVLSGNRFSGKQGPFFVAAPAAPGGIQEKDIHSVNERFVMIKNDIVRKILIFGQYASTAQELLRF